MVADSSRLYQATTTLASRSARALDGSRIRSALETATTRATTYVTQSSLYRWLTKEPDPEVIVIDLRETYTVGPFITLLDHVINRLAPIYRNSRLKDGADAIAALLARAADTRPGQVLAALFKPPEPPPDATDAQDDTSPPTDRNEDSSADDVSARDTE